MIEQVFHALSRYHDVVLVLDSAGVVTHAHPTPPPPGVFVGDDLVDCRLVEILLPKLREELAELVGDALDGEHCRANLRLDKPARRLVVELVPSEEAPIAYVVVTGRVDEIRDPLRDPRFDDLETLRMVLEDLGIGVLIQGPQAEILMTNPRALELLGLSEAQLLGASSFDPRWHVVRDDGSDFPGPEHPVPVSIETKSDVRDVVMGVFRPATSDRIWLRVNALPKLDADGNIRHVLCTFADITSEREAVAALRSEHALLHSMMETSLTGLAVLDPSGVITFANPACEEILGLARSEIQSRTYNAPEWKSTDVDGGPWPDERQPFVRVMTTKKPVYDIRHAIEWPDGRRKILSINGAPVLDGNGEVERCVFGISDITDQVREAAERERMYRDMEQLARLESLTVLAGGVAHDFNNILVGVLGSAQLALDELGDDHPVSADLEVISNSARRAADLTRQLLAFAGHGRYDMRAVDLSALVDELRPLLAALISKHIHLKIHTAPSSRVIIADPSQITQVVMNLTLNAAQAIGEGSGTIVIETRNQTLDPHEQPGVVQVARSNATQYSVVSVIDDGVGMDENLRRRVFEPFFTTHDEGHGLGLAAVAGIVRGHNGFIAVKSKPGRGSCFEVGIPSDAGTARQRTPDAAMPSLFQTDIVALVVDDEDVILQVASRTLERAGARVLTAENGDQALALVEQIEKLGAVFVDMNMPGMSGVEVVERIRRDDAEVPIVLMSGFTEHQLDSLDERTTFLAKPFTPASLLAALQLALG